MTSATFTFRRYSTGSEARLGKWHAATRGARLEDVLPRGLGAIVHSGALTAVRCPLLALTACPPVRHGGNQRLLRRQDTLNGGGAGPAGGVGAGPQAWAGLTGCDGRRAVATVM